MKISIFIQDEQYLTREGIKSIIKNNEQYFLIENESKISTPINELVSSLKPDILIMDYLINQNNEQSLIEEIKIFSRETNVLIISDDQKNTRIKGVIASGIKGFLTKHCSLREIEDALEAISSGKKFYCQEVLQLMMNPESESTSQNNSGESILSEREQEILSLIGKGLTSKKIADRLFISIHTVNSHRKNLLRKLDMKSPAELIVYALENP